MSNTFYSLEDAWKEYKNGKKWAEYLPTCRDETLDAHSRHMLFVQGWYAHAYAHARSITGEHCSGCSGWEAWGPFDEGRECSGV